jgi:hypothetical protein
MISTGYVYKYKYEYSEHLEYIRIHNYTLHLNIVLSTIETLETDVDVDSSRYLGV